MNININTGKRVAFLAAMRRIDSSRAREMLDVMPAEAREMLDRQIAHAEMQAREMMEGLPAEQVDQFVQGWMYGKN
ncbi:MAG: hypothetical protein LUE08_00055 [Akkermansiaceae bacterium]|nr:hypothetical protein [Akkermansiaceae bacterium]